MIQRGLRIGAGLCLAGLISFDTPALVDPGTPDPRSIQPRLAQGRLLRADARAESTAVGAAARAFLARHGGSWEFHVDPRTGLAGLVQGQGIPLFRHAGPESAAPRLADLAPLVDAFLEQQRDLVVPATGRLVLDEERSVVLEGGRLVFVSYDWELGGVPVEGASVFVRINSGNVIQFGSDLVGPAAIDSKPLVTAADALSRLLAHSGDAETAQLRGEPRLTIQPEEAAGDGLAYRLVWVMRYKSLGRHETWEGRIDARTGAVAGFRDVNAYGRVVGAVHPRTVIDPEVTVPFPSARVVAGTSQLTTDTAGRYTYPGGTVASGLNGVYFDTLCSGCTNPAQPGVSAAMGTGRLDFGTGGSDATGNGASSRADRNAFYHLQQVRRLGKKWLPSLGWLNSTLGTVVNIPDVCNAYYDGNVNFFRSGGGCNNTGEIADVMQHEWGHGLDYATRSGDGATGEGTADVVAMHMTHSPLVGPYFLENGGAVRDLDSTRVGVMTRTNIASYCPAGSGPLGYQVHCEGEIYGQTSWDLAKALVAKHGHHTGWRTSERLFFSSLPNARSYLPTGSLPIYSAYLAVDDDDGNLANGTPNGAEIYAAFNTHGIAGAAVVSSAACARPAQPQLTVTPACDRISLSWEAVPGASQYRVFRSEVLLDTAHFQVATLASGQTSWDDLEVAPDADYWYTVQAVSASACESTVENPVAARLADQPILSVVVAVGDDSLRGNRSGFPDPGEEVDLRVTLTNSGAAAATGIAGSIVAVTPGVTVLDGSDGWPAIGAGGTGVNAGVLRFVTDAGQVACGSAVRFRLAPVDGSGCASENSYFEVLMGENQGGPFVCDPTPACFTPPSFDGALVAGTGPSCGETVVTWSPAASNCANAAITYDVFRGTAPDFLPSPANRVATGLAGTSFLDTLLAPGATYHYLVRAVDSRSGEDGNLVRRAAVASSAQDVSPPAFAGLASAAPGAGCGEVRLDWSPALESCGQPVAYDVYRSTDPAVTADPANLVATTLSAGYVDAALPPGQAVYYLVRARDAWGNSEANSVRVGASPGALDRLLHRETFDVSDGGWSQGTPNDATSGLWEWGDPEGTTVQPEDDHTPDPGTGCWATGLARAGGDSANDVDGGYTALVSPAIDLTGSVTPFIRFARWFSNDRGGGAAEDPLETYVSNNGGTSWVRIDVVSGGTPLDWVRVERNLGLPRTANMRFRLVARDLLNSSLVEAAMDDFEVWDRGQGCLGCPQPAPTVGTIRVDRIGADVVLDWSADPIQASRFVVYQVFGTGFGESVRIGSTSSRSFVHQGAILAQQDAYYRVAAVDACGMESSKN